MTRTRKSILEMNHQEAKQFFLKTSSFFSTSLPNYIDLSVGIEKAVDLLKNKPFTELVRHKRSLVGLEFFKLIFDVIPIIFLCNPVY